MTLEELQSRMRPEDVAASKAIAAAAPLPGPDVIAKLIVLFDTARRAPREAA